MFNWLFGSADDDEGNAPLILPDTNDAVPGAIPTAIADPGYDPDNVLYWDEMTDAQKAEYGISKSDVDLFPHLKK